MIGSSQILYRLSYQFVLWGLLVWSIGGATPAVWGQALAVNFAPIPAPPPTPQATAYSLDPNMKPMVFGYKFRREANGVVTLAPAGASPSTFGIVFDDGVGANPPPPAEVKVQLTYQGQSRTFTIKHTSVKVVKGDYEVDVTELSNEVVNWIASRNNPDLDPYDLPKEIFTVTDVKFTVAPINGKPKSVEPGKVKPQITFEEKN